MPPKGQTKNQVAKPVKEFFEAHPDEVIKLYRLINATGFEDKQIRSAISFARLNGYPLEVVTRGQAWIYRGVKSGNDLASFVTEVQTVPEAECTPVEPEFDDEKGFYQTSTSVEGYPILQKDSDGTFWLAKRI